MSAVRHAVIAGAEAILDIWTCEKHRHRSGPPQESAPCGGPFLSQRTGPPEIPVKKSATFFDFFRIYKQNRFFEEVIAWMTRG